MKKVNKFDQGFRPFMIALTFLIGLGIAGPLEASDMTKVNLKQNSKVKRYTIKKIDSTRVAVLKGDVDNWNIQAIIKQIEGFAEEPRRPAYLDIDSPGGSIRAGMDLINTIIGLKKTTGFRLTCVITGSAYSMAGVIASYCHKTFMTLGSDMMFHGASYGVQGNAEEVLARVLFLTNWLRDLEVELAAQMGITYKQFRLIRGRELWLTSKEAVRGGYADGLLTSFYHTAEPPKRPQMPLFFGLGGMKDDEEFSLDFDYITHVETTEEEPDSDIQN